MMTIMVEMLKLEGIINSKMLSNSWERKISENPSGLPS